MATEPAGGPRAIETVEALQKWTEKELAQEVDRLIDFANSTEKQAGEKSEEVADELFRVVCLNETSRVLSDKVKATRLYTALVAHAGKKLQLTRDELNDYLRVGALNQRIDDKRWDDLRWSWKLELLPLARKKDGLKTFWRGLVFAGRPKVTRNDLRDWVQKRTPRKLKSGGRPRGATFDGVVNFVATGHDITSEEKRSTVVSNIRKASKDERRALLQQLRELQHGMAQLLAELEDDDT